MILKIIAFIVFYLISLISFVTSALGLFLIFEIELFGYETEVKMWDVCSVISWGIILGTVSIVLAIILGRKIKSQLK